MKWHAKLIIKRSIGLVVALLLTSLFVLLLIWGTNEDIGAGVLFYVFLILFMAIVTFSQCKQLIEAIKDYKEADSNLLLELKYVNPYGSPAELSAAYEAQKSNALYQDDKISITYTFLHIKDNYKIFMVDGVLDAGVYTQKVNGVIDYVSFIFLYYDGKRYEIKYKRPLGISDMQKKIQEVKTAASILAVTSKNYRKYPAYRL